MSRDYKPRNKQPAKRPARGNTLIGMFIGLVLGVLLSFGVVWYLNKTPLPFQDKGRTATNNSTAVPPTQELQTSQPEDGKPRFEFYKILPKENSAARAPAPVAAPKEAPVASVREVLYLQVGAFQRASDADNLKTRLALMGLEASVQQVSTSNKGILNRVRLGPYEKPEDVDQVRNQLGQAGIQSSIVKTK